jgi:hypothetical protein
MQLRVRERFSDLQKLDHGRVPWTIIDAAQSVEGAGRDIWKVASDTIERVGSKPISKLWQEGYYDNEVLTIITMGCESLEGKNNFGVRT